MWCSINKLFILLWTDYETMDRFQKGNSNKNISDDIIGITRLSFTLSLLFLAFLPFSCNFIRNDDIHFIDTFSSDTFLVEYEVEPGCRCSFLDAK